MLQNASAQAALQAAQALSGQNDTQGGPNTVLRVIIEHMMYPITLEVLYQVSLDSLCELSCKLIVSWNYYECTFYFKIWGFINDYSF